MLELLCGFYLLQGSLQGWPWCWAFTPTGVTSLSSQIDVFYQESSGHLWPPEEAKASANCAHSWLGCLSQSFKSQLNWNCFLVPSFHNTLYRIGNNLQSPICFLLSLLHKAMTPGGRGSPLTSHLWAHCLIYSRSSIYICWRYESLPINNNCCYCCRSRLTVCFWLFPNDQIGWSEINRHSKFLLIFTAEVVFNLPQERSRSKDNSDVFMGVFWRLHGRSQMPVPVSGNLLSL